MAKQEIVWVISSTIIKYSLGEPKWLSTNPCSCWTSPVIGPDLATHKCFQAKNWEFDKRFLRQVMQIVLFIYESEIF